MEWYFYFKITVSPRSFGRCFATGVDIIWSQMFIALIVEQERKWKLGGISSSDNIKGIIAFYFKKGYRYNSIKMILAAYHDVFMSVRTIKRRLRAYGLRRRNALCSHHMLRNIIRNEIRGPSSLRGYRGIWNMLRSTYNITVPRDLVMSILRDLDPVSSLARKSRRLSRRTYVSQGANATWHTDGYDKLKHYGFPIHGCIDGFSRKIMWLKVSRSNNPVVTASFFLHSVNEFGLVPHCCAQIVALKTGYWQPYDVHFQTIPACIAMGHPMRIKE